MFYDNAAGLFRIIVVGTLAYVWLILVLRVTGKRTLAQLNAFDFIVTVALGSTLATVVVSRTVALAAGALGLALLAVLQLVLAWLSVRVPMLRHAVTAAPTLLLRNGQPLADALARQRISEESLRQVIRSSGIGDVEHVSAVVLETDGKISVIIHSQLGSGSALVDVPGAEPGEHCRTSAVGDPGG